MVQRSVGGGEGVELHGMSERWGRALTGCAGEARLLGRIVYLGRFSATLWRAGPAYCGHGAGKGG